METATLDGITATSASESQESILASLQPEGTQAEPVVTEPKAAEPSPAAPAPKKSSYQSRIDTLSAELANKDQAIGALNQRLQEVEDLKRQIAALRAPQPQQQPQAQQQPAEDAEPTEDQFETYAGFVKAQAAWTVRQERKAWEAQQARREQMTARQQTEAGRQEAFQKRLEAAKTTIPNFDAVLASTIPLSRPMQDAIKDSEIGPQLMAHLHNHPEEHERIYRAGSPLQVFKEMNKLEARLEGAVSSGPPPKAKPVSAAKPPIKPLGAANSAVTDGPPGDDASVEDHFKYWDRIEAEAYAKR